MQMTRFAFIIVVTAAALGACSSTPVAPTAGNSAASVTNATAPALPSALSQDKSGTASPAAATSAALPAYRDPNSLISSERSVYFDYDVYTVNNEYKGLIERQGRYLSARPELSIKIEGNADERGSAEYNLALGQKRAQAVLRALKIYGVRDSQMEAVSWGRERPRALGHTEAAWAQNRRADIVYP